MNTERDKSKLYIVTYSDPNPYNENRQSFSAEWWYEKYHLGPQWFGQMFYSKIEDVAKQFPSKELVITKRR